MFVIEFRTTDFRPDLSVTLRNDVDGWDHDVVGVFQDDGWRFELDEDDYQQGLHFKFVLEGSYWMLGDDLFVQASAGAVFTFTDAQVGFPPYDQLIVEAGRVQQMFFPTVLPGEKIYDVIVVGSGMGGGILADQLSDLGVDTLVLEAGSYLFPTHVANLPRQHRIGQFDKHVWGLYDEFKVVNYENTPGSVFGGGQAFNLGGRSVFWGGFAPRMTWWELDGWPQSLRWYLEGPGYARGEDAINVSRPTSTYQEQLKVTLARDFADFVHSGAPLSVQYVGAAGAAVPAGMFSTADLLMESALTTGSVGKQFLSINLNHAVVRVETDSERVTEVIAHDLISDTERSFKARHVVLCAGTIETAKIAMMSGIDDPSGKLGVGLTDHPIYYLHFSLPGDSRHYSAGESAKILSQHRNADREQHPYNVLLELGADLNQGRFVDDDILRQHRDQIRETMLCELVFLFDQPLIEDNRLEHEGPAFVKPTLHVQKGDAARPMADEITDVKDHLMDLLGAQPLAGQSLDLQEAVVGGVAHEVGTARLGEQELGVVDEDLRFLAYDNLYACDLSVFPSSPAANPSLTLVALAIRLADHLRQRLGR